MNGVWSGASALWKAEATMELSGGRFLLEALWGAREGQGASRGEIRGREGQNLGFFFLSSPARPRGKEWLEESDGEERSEERKFAKKTSSSLILLVVSFSPSSLSRFPNPHVFSLEAL